MRTAYVIDVPTALREELLRYQPPEGELPKRLIAAPPMPMVSVTPLGVGWREIRNFLGHTCAARRGWGRRGDERHRAVAPPMERISAHVRAVAK